MVYEWLHSQPKEFFLEVFTHFRSAKTSIESNGHYIEEGSLCVPFVFNKLQDKKHLRFSFDSSSYFEQILFPIPQTQNCATTSNHSPMTEMEKTPTKDRRMKKIQTIVVRTAQIYTCGKRVKGIPRRDKL